jgi:hypothetical protein
MPPDSTLHLHLLAMDKHLVDGDLAAQLTMPPECALPLQPVKDAQPFGG